MAKTSTSGEWQVFFFEILASLFFLGYVFFLAFGSMSIVSSLLLVAGISERAVVMHTRKGRGKRQRKRGRKRQIDRGTTRQPVRGLAYRMKARQVQVGKSRALDWS